MNYFQLSDSELEMLEQHAYTLDQLSTFHAAVKGLIMAYDIDPKQETFDLGAWIEFIRPYAEKPFAKPKS